MICPKSTFVVVMHVSAGPCLLICYIQITFLNKTKQYENMTAAAELIRRLDFSQSYLKLVQRVVTGTSVSSVFALHDFYVIGLYVFTVNCIYSR